MILDQHEQVFYILHEEGGLILNRKLLLSIQQVNENWSTFATLFSISPQKALIANKCIRGES